MTRVDGYYLSFVGEKPDLEYKTRAYQFFKLALENAYDLAAAGQVAVIGGMLYPLLSAPSGYYGTPISVEVHDYFQSSFRHDFACNAFVGFLGADEQFKVDDFERFAKLMLGCGDDFLNSQERVERPSRRWTATWRGPRKSKRRSR